MKRVTAVLAVVLLGAGLAACTGEPVDNGGVATAATTPPATTPPPAKLPAMTMEERRELFISCMRGEGIEFQEPPPGAQWSGVVMNRDMPPGKNTVFLAAMEKCEAQLPPVPPPVKPDAATIDKYRAYAQCMREHGIADFADPTADGELTGAWLRENDPAAVAACESLLPDEDLGQ